MSRSAKKAWYRDGLRFECTQCGQCCSGEPGFVWVDDDEVAAMAELLRIDVASFRNKFVRRVEGRSSLVEYSDGDCIFLEPESRACAVYSARPVQCRTWPFWDSNLHSATAWREACQVCPGAGQGRLYVLETIEESRKKRRV